MGAGIAVADLIFWIGVRDLQDKMKKLATEHEKEALLAALVRLGIMSVTE